MELETSLNSYRNKIAHIATKIIRVAVQIYVLRRFTLNRHTHRHTHNRQLLTGYIQCVRTKRDQNVFRHPDVVGTALSFTGVLLSFFF